MSGVENVPRIECTQCGVWQYAEGSIVDCHDGRLLCKRCVDPVLDAMVRDHLFRTSVPAVVCRALCRGVKNIYLKLRKTSNASDRH